MRQFLKFKPNQGPVFVTPEFNVDLLVGTFTLSVWDKNGEEVFSKREEVTETIDPIRLPDSNSETDMYMVELNATIVSQTTPREGERYIMTLKAEQSGHKLDDPAKAEGPLPSTFQVVTIILVLHPIQAITT